jgi:hypothetical protein
VDFALSDHAGTTRFSGIDQRAEAIGAAAASQLHARIQCGEKGIPEIPSVTMIKGRWSEAAWPAAAQTAIAS